MLHLPWTKFEWGMRSLQPCWNKLRIFLVHSVPTPNKPNLRETLLLFSSKRVWNNEVFWHKNTWSGILKYKEIVSFVAEVLLAREVVTFRHGLFWGILDWRNWNIFGYWWSCRNKQMCGYILCLALSIQGWVYFFFLTWQLTNWALLKSKCQQIIFSWK